MSPHARNLTFFTGTLIVAAVFVRLGFWQLSRYGERRAENAAVERARLLPPVLLDDPAQAALAPGSAIHQRRVRVTGVFDHAAEVVVRRQSLRGVPGVRIVTPFHPLRGDTAILVQRGFVPGADAERMGREPSREEGAREVQGIALVQPDSGAHGSPLEREGRLTWERVDLPALRARLPYPLAGYVILQTPDSAAPPLPIRDHPPATDAGPHLSYALQWFSFAVTALVVGGLVAFRKRKTA